ncbi:fibronectin type III domain-containing protein [Paenibacillus eucommiae]|uniref:Fibronectin type-III domain-containing protein n=1 Tax=Paenibacillus eucommiae TaxID=1355755 RepID=A0ABS4IUV9_9BACL|nr:fibronectin type III domain-containing protein [Paenibacillus eucommiae]MBP1990359.1 hypothetical protein [Paenibacillus eucommiae]
MSWIKAIILQANKSTLDKLSDNGNILLFNGSPVGGGDISGISFEDWTVGQQVQIVDDIPPLDPEVATISISNVQQTSLTLNWGQSASLDVSEYEVYKGGTIMATLAPPYSKFQFLEYKVTQLLPNTTYTFSIKAVDTSNNRSKGVSITTKTIGNRAIAMNGITDFLKLPSLTFTTIELKFALHLPIPVPSNVSIVDARSGIANAYYERSSNGSDNIGAGWNSIYINGVINQNIPIPNDVVTILQLNLSYAGTDDINIFSNSGGEQRAAGSIYYVKLFNNGNLVAYYDFTTQFIGSVVDDSSGKGSPAAILTGGTWITP